MFSAQIHSQRKGSHCNPLSYTLPKLHTGKSWYVDFTCFDPAEGRMNPVVTVRHQNILLRHNLFINRKQAEEHKKSLRFKTESEAQGKKTATTYSPTVTQYHRRDRA